MKDKVLSSNQKLAINIIASLLSFAVTSGINLFLSPYIVNSIGVEAYGFVGLANNFISYATLITIALNALAGRFITIKIHNKDYEEANKYYSSVFLANCVISIVLIVFLTGIWIYLEKLIDIPDNIVWDVKILFASLFLNCILSTVGSVFSVSTFATNKLYLSSLQSIGASMIRAIVLVAMFTLFAPRVSYLGVTTLLSGIYILLVNIYYTYKLLPFIRISRKLFDFKAVKELIISGVWNLVTRIGQIFTDGLDLLITNLFINPTAMGVLSLSKTIPTVITSIVGSVVNSFSPNFTILYAENKIDELVSSLRQSMKIMGILANLPVIILIVCGKEFYSLWQPSQDSSQLVVLSVLTCAGLIFNGGINCVYNIFTVVNKLRFNAIVLLIASLLSTGIVFVLIQVTSLGVYAVAGVSTVIMIIKNVFIIVPYASRCLGLKWYALYGDVFKPVIFVSISCSVGFVISRMSDSVGWLHLFVVAVIVGVCSCLIGLFVILNSTDRMVIYKKLLKRGGNRR